MNQRKFESLKNWFADYCASFSTPVKEDQRNITIKQDHTHEVCRNALRIAGDLKLDDREALLAESIALFHDVGRFPQYARYRTFDDSVSVNHAALGAKVLLDRQVLRDLERPEQELIVRVVTLHNVFALPDGLDSTTKLFAKLIRDADKLDIIRVVIEYLGQEAGQRAEAVGLGLPDDPGYSAPVLASLTRGEMARKADLKTLNDFKLLQLSWLYDLNFSCSLRIVLERGYVDTLGAMLPPDAEIARAVEVVRSLVAGRLTSG